MISFVCGHNITEESSVIAYSRIDSCVRILWNFWTIFKQWTDGLNQSQQCPRDFGNVNTVVQ